MKTQTFYTIPGTCAAPERGRGLQNWTASMQKGEVDGEIRDVERNCQEGVVIRTNWVYNNTFGMHINELAAILKIKLHKRLMWKETLPKNCPPTTATEMNQDVFRILQSENPSENDFTPYVKLYPENGRYKTLCKAYAISFYDNIENARDAYKLAQKRGKAIGNYFGQFTLAPTDGRSEYTPTSGHYSTWFYNSWDFSNFNCSFVTAINEN